MYPFASYSLIQNNLAEIIHSKVSIRARSPGQFLSIYQRYGIHLPAEWDIKRNNFIKRTYAAYIKKPSRRRQLALLVWAFST